MKSAKPFYQSRAWQRCRAAVLARDNHLCQVCLKKGRLTPANTVHHIEHLTDNPSRALDESNLISICATCHNKLHPEKGQGKPKQQRKRKARVIRSVANEERA
ncbi:HNH endonuclease [Thermoactinomyces daqus]|uniref:Putative HNH nuclease YajD n=2 Tax=Thermoactinomyces daqus TaxID=1329516 RepID=A0A7W1XBY7_9BACL|nr:HNH endonuclease signature motif containing protein [Thermoactinomyces daqus]MBA4543843.1 HNH endonuclease [Thermoactinomyces daqus]